MVPSVFLDMKFSGNKNLIGPVWNLEVWKKKGGVCRRFHHINKLISVLDSYSKLKIAFWTRKLFFKQLIGGAF